MIIGVPKEIKEQEHRVGLVPSTASTLTRRGHKVLVQKSAGAGAGYTDQDYVDVGATIIDTAEIAEAAWFDPNVLPSPRHLYFENLICGRCLPARPLSVPSLLTS